MRRRAGGVLRHAGDMRMMIIIMGVVVMMVIIMGMVVMMITIMGLVVMRVGRGGGRCGACPLTAIGGGRGRGRGRGLIWKGRSRSL